jgi:hypothetical protein
MYHWEGPASSTSWCGVRPMPKSPSKFEVQEAQHNSLAPFHSAKDLTKLLAFQLTTIARCGSMAGLPWVAFVGLIQHKDTVGIVSEFTREL